MMELTINGQVYQFNFGMGFLREANKTVTEKINGSSNAKRNVGATYLIAGVIDGNPEDLVSVLDLANRGQTPRVTAGLLDTYIDDPETDIDQLCNTTLDFLEKANATKRIMRDLRKAEQKMMETEEK